MKNKLLCLLLILAVTACTSSKKLMTPASGDVEKMSQQGVQTDMASLQAGHSLFLSNCGKCHALIPPPNRTVDQWNKILPKMFPKTKLTEEEQGKVRNYIMARR